MRRRASGRPSARCSAWSMLVAIGLLQVSGVWTAFMNDLQTRFGGASLPL